MQQAISWMTFFQLLQHYSPSALCVIVPFFPPLFLFDSDSTDEKSLSVPSHLLMSIDFSDF